MSESALASPLISAELLVHGLSVRLEAYDADVLAPLAADYGRFTTATRLGAPDIELRVLAPGSALAGSRPGFGRSRVRISGASVSLSPSPVTPQEIYYDQLRPYLTGMVAAELLRRRGVFMFHAAAVAHGGGATIFVGDRGAGKTTLCLSALAAGGVYMANDLLFLETGARPAVLAMPQPPLVGAGAALSLRPLAPAWRFDHVPQPPANLSPGELQYVGGRKAKLDPGSLPMGPLTAPLHRIVFPQPDFDLDHPRVDPLGADEAALRLAAQVLIPLKPGLTPDLPFQSVLRSLEAALCDLVGSTELVMFRWCSDAAKNVAALRALEQAP